MNFVLFAVNSISYGQTVGVVTTDAPDVANDKTLNKGHFRINRTGSTNQALTVNFSLPASASDTPNAAQPANVTNTANTDYTLWVKDAASTNEPTLLANVVARTGSLSFGTNVIALDVEVRPEHDEDLESEGVWLTITSVPNGAIQPSNSTACVAIYDGPRYSIIDLPIGPSEFAVCALKNTGGDLTTMPDIVGYRRDNGCLLSYTTNGYTRLSLDNPSGSSSGYGLGISDDGVMAGYVSGSPEKAVCWAPATNYAPALLASLSSAGNAAAFAISPNAQYIAGYAVNSSSTPHAVRWDTPGSWTLRDLGALGASQTNTSYAYALNNDGRVVGASQGGTNSPSVLRAFRTAAGATSIASSDELRPYINTNIDLGLDGITVSNFVNAATSISSLGAAVGWSDAAVVTSWDAQGQAHGEKQHRALYWGTDGVPVDLGVLPGGNWSEATAINDAVAVQVVGWSRTSWDTNSVVGFISGGPWTTMVSVQDQNLFYGSTNWSLTKPVDINNEGYILGNGNFNGRQASWLLVPLH